MSSFKQNYRIKTKEQAAMERELRRREKEFTAAHENDSDEELLSYLKQFATENPDLSLFKNNVPGGDLIGKRFGGWLTALQTAELPAPMGQPEQIGYTRQQQKNATAARKRQQQEFGRRIMKTKSEN